jgi:hypothetical protein
MLGSIQAQGPGENGYSLWLHPKIIRRGRVQAQRGVERWCVHDQHGVGRGCVQAQCGVGLGRVQVQHGVGRGHAQTQRGVGLGRVQTQPSPTLSLKWGWFEKPWPINKPFITFKGSASNMPTLTFTARVYGTVYCATLQVDSAYFVASNIIIVIISLTLCYSINRKTLSLIYPYSKRI